MWVNREVSPLFLCHNLIMKISAIDILNRIVKDPMVVDVPIVYLTRIVILSLKAIDEIEKEAEKDVQKSNDAISSTNGEPRNSVCRWFKICGSLPDDAKSRSNINGSE